MEGKGWHGHSLKGRVPRPTLALTGFYWFNLHRNIGRILKAHQSLSGSNNQIDNIQDLGGLILNQGEIAKGL